jgi:carboxymethylenebutenolidase
MSPETTDVETFRSGGVPVSVEWFPASRSLATERYPAVLMLHGADGLTMRGGEYRAAARAIAAGGCHVALLHYLDRTRERWASLATIQNNFRPWMDTLSDAITWLQKHPGVDPQRIGLIGISLGAALSLATAGHDNRIKAMVDYFGPMPPGFERTTRFPPTLILHGAADPIVPVANAYAVETVLKNLGVPHEIMVYPGQGHVLYGEAQEDAERRVTAFLERYLKPQS